MSNISSKGAWPIKLMRWAARLLSVIWAFWALFWTWFVLANLVGEGRFSLAVSIIILFIVLLMFLGAAIIASVWRKEAFGGGVLLLEGVLIIASIGIVYFLVDVDIHPPLWLITWAFFTMVLPPLAAGSLFLACHRRSKTPG